jgi:polar amino acid transport system permease protein
MVLSNVFNLLIQAYPLFLMGMLHTLMTAAGATIIGIAGGLVFGILTSEKLKMPIISPLINTYTLIIQGTPVYLQLLIMYYAIPDLIGINLSPLTAGIITLGCNSIAYVTQIMRGSINTVPHGQWEACYVLGYSKPAALQSIILPQALKNALPALTNELVVLLKETSILSMIGVVEITRIGMNISAKTLDPMTTYLAIALLYLSITSCINYGSKKLEKELNHD